MEVNGSIEKVRDIILNANDLHLWNYRTTASKLIKKLSERQAIVWMALDLPWPLKNRDVVVQTTLKTDNDDHVFIMIHPDPYNSLPKKDGYIRITTFNGHWSLQQKGNKVLVTQQVHGDPAGNLPNWLSIPCSPKRRMRLF